MDTGKLRNQYDETIDPTQPLPVDTVEAQRKVSISETLTYNGKAAAGAITINSVAQKAIVSVEGDQVASYWGLEKNKVYEAKVDRSAKEGEPRLRTVTETNGSAAVVIIDAAKDLELLFESLTTTVKRYVIKVTDTGGNSLYGWIFGVAKSTDTYTLDVVNNRLTETQNWVGTLANFDNTLLAKVEIFRYNSSLVFGTGTSLTEEVICPREYSKSWSQSLKYASENLSNGQYFVDYMRGRIIGKKADATASETVTYNILSSTSTSSSGAGTDTTLADDSAFTVGTSQVTPAGFLADETATDSIDEGDIGAARMTLNRRAITAGHYAEDAAHVSGDYGNFILGVRRDTAASSAGTDGDYSAIGLDSLGHVWTREGYAPVAEDNVAGVIKIEHRYSTSGALTADTQVKASAGFVHTVTISQGDAAPTAGTIDIYDNTSAAGTKIFSWNLTTAVFNPFTVTLDVSCANGIYADFTTTGDVNVFISYR